MRRVWMSLVTLALSVGLAAEGRAQEADLATHRPRFLAANSAGGVRVDASNAAALRRHVSLTLSGAAVEDALKEIARQANLELMFTSAVLPPGRPVTLHASDITVGAALTQVLWDTGLDVLLLPGGQMGLVPRPLSGAPTTRMAGGTVSGQVTDAETGQGLVGAEVTLEKTRWRAATGEDGRYHIADVEPGSYTLVVRGIGYGKRSQAVTVVAGQEVTVDVALEPVATQLDEIVTTATGEQRRLELGHVVGRINADSVVKEAPVSSLSDLLSGRVPGLQVFQSQGTVGGEVHLQVRTPNSITLSTEPIIVVDGVRYSSTAVQRPQFARYGPGNVEPTSPLNDINPNEIETIEVVKGPSAATLYGTDAANGVLVITTKRGRPGAARWNAYAKGSTTEIPVSKYPDLYWGWGTVFGVTNRYNCSLLWLADGTCTQRDSITVLRNPLNDSELTLFRRSPQWAYGGNVSGGRQDLRYYFSGDFERATGPLQMPRALATMLAEQRGSELLDEQLNPNKLSKVNLRANVTAMLGERAEIRVNTGYVHSGTRSLSNGFESPYAPSIYGGNPTQPYSPYNNPAEVFLQTSTEVADRFFGSANGQWHPASWLVGRAAVGLDLTNRNQSSLARRGDTPNAWVYTTGAAIEDRIRQMATTAELGVTGTIRRGRLSARTSVGAQYVRTFSEDLSSLGEDLPPGGVSISQAARVTSNQARDEAVTLGTYVEETLGLNERLFITGAVRVDGASTFGRNYDATVYPKGSVSWLVSEEPFMPRVPGLDELRLRYAVGASGQQPRPEWAGPSFVSGGTTVDGERRGMVRLTGLGNVNLRPERVREHEFGVDASAFTGRLRLELTWYRRRTVDQIVAASLPPGLGSVYTNLGLTTARGFEAQLTARLVDAPAVSWDVAVQHSSIGTTLVDIGDARPRYSNQGGAVAGYPLGARFMQQLEGYADANGNGVIEPGEVQMSDTAVYVGPSTPPHAQTLTSVVGLFRERLRISALLERRSGFTQINSLHPCSNSNACREAVDPTTSLADQAYVVAHQRQPPFADVQYVFLEKGDFTRLREVTASLDLPAGMARALQVRSATLSVSARNLALWTSFSGPDPETATVGGVAGGSAAGIPQTRSWSLRLDLGL